MVVVSFLAVPSTVSGARLHPDDNQQETPGILVTPTAGLVTSEAGGTATFAVVLTTQPAADVSIALSSSDESEGTVDQATLTFSTTNWDQPQTVTVTGVDDAVDDGDIAYAVTLTPSSEDPIYNALNPQQVNLTNLDDDTAGISLAPSGNQTTEAGESVTINVQLTSQPLSDVIITASSSNPDEGAVSPASLTFSPSNWSAFQHFTVAGQNDAVDDGDIAYTVTLTPSSSDPIYDALGSQQVSLTNLDDDTAGVTVTPTSDLTTSESGGTARFTIRLNSQPTANVVFNLYSDNPGEGTISTSTLTFTVENWMTPQTVTITGQDDTPPVVDGSVTYHIVIPAPETTDSLYAAINPPDVTVVNTDNDAPGITVNPTSGLFTTEKGGKVTFTIALNTAPYAPVTLGIASSNINEGGLDKGYVVFNDTNWSAPQTVTITGVNDLVDDGDMAYFITITVLPGSDARYLNLADIRIDIINLDDDGPAVTVGDARVTEPESGTILMDFPVNLAAESPDEIVMIYSTEDVTATAGDDYLPVTNDQLTIPPQTISSHISITINSDHVYEGSETFKLKLAVEDTDKATLATTQAIGTIDEPLPVLQFDAASYSVSEKDEFVEVSVTLSEPLKTGLTPVSVAYTTLDGTAKAGEDFTAVSGTLTFNAGDTHKTLRVAIIQDSVNDPGETFQIKLDSLTGPAQMTPNPLFTTVTILEGRRWLYLPITLNRPMPDLIGNITIEPVKQSYSISDQVLIKATITNQGSMPAGDFYVDVYFNPQEPPTGPNFDQNFWCVKASRYCYWISWEVPQLAAGESITLTSEDNYIFDKWWPGNFEDSGEYHLYLVVDSWSKTATYGQVNESNEANNISSLTTTVK